VTLFTLIARSLCSQLFEWNNKLSFTRRSWEQNFWHLSSLWLQTF